MIIFWTEWLCDLNQTLDCFISGMSLSLDLKHQRLWFLPGEFFPAEMTIAGSGLVNWPLQTQLSVKERQYFSYTDKKKTCMINCMQKLHILHYDPGPQVKVLLYYLQQFIFVPVGRAVIKHWDGEWMTHTNGIGDLQGTTEMVQILYVDLKPHLWIMRVKSYKWRKWAMTGFGALKNPLVLSPLLRLVYLLFPLIFFFPIPSISNIF